MLAPDRQTQIAQLLRERASMSVQALSEEFKVSPMTVRRDLKLLEEKGIAVRIHGGALVPQSQVASREEARGMLHVQEKMAIGAAAAKLVQEGQTLFIDAGTTTFELAKCLRLHRGLTVVTNGIRILSALADSPGINLIASGGTVYSGAWSFVGPLAEGALRRFNTDVAFMGISSLSLEQGFTEVNFFEAAVKSLAIQRARRVILLADSSKFEKVSPNAVANLNEFDLIITDEGLSENLLKAYRSAQVQIMTAPCLTSETTNFHGKN